MSKMTRDRLAHIDLFPSSPGCWRRQRAVATTRSVSGTKPSPAGVSGVSRNLRGRTPHRYSLLEQADRDLSDNPKPRKSIATQA
jgi:hypothetical protein